MFNKPGLDENGETCRMSVAEYKIGPKLHRQYHWVKKTI